MVNDDLDMINWVNKCLLCFMMCACIYMYVCMLREGLYVEIGMVVNAKTVLEMILMKRKGWGTTWWFKLMGWYVKFWNNKFKEKSSIIGLSSKIVILWS